MNSLSLSPSLFLKQKWSDNIFLFARLLLHNKISYVNFNVVTCNINYIIVIPVLLLYIVSGYVKEIQMISLSYF